MFVHTNHIHKLKFPVEAVVTACYLEPRGGSFSLAFTSEMEAEHWADSYIKQNQCSCTIEYTHAELPF